MDEESGMTLALHEISPDEAVTYYQRRTSRLQAYMEYSYPNTPSAVKQALTMNEQVKTPFNYNYGVGNSDSFEYLSVCILLIALLSAVIVAPTFSSEYQSGSDDILRYTK